MALVELQTEGSRCLFFVPKGHMTLEQIQQAIHRIYEGDVDYPNSTDEDFLLRSGLINEGIARWESDEDGTLWNELFVSLEDAADGDKTVLENTSEYDAPSDYKFPAGYLRIAGTFFKLVKAEQVHIQPTGSRYYYVTGNQSIGFTIHIIGIGESMVGETIAYDYYKTALTLSSTTDVPEMSNPLYLVHHTLSTLFDLDGDDYRSGKHFQLAEGMYRGMKLKNIQTTWHQESSFGMDDTTPGFGVGDYYGTTY